MKRYYIHMNHRDLTVVLGERVGTGLYRAYFMSDVTIPGKYLYHVETNTIFRNDKLSERYPVQHVIIREELASGTPAEQFKRFLEDQRVEDEEGVYWTPINWMEEYDEDGNSLVTLLSHGFRFFFDADGVLRGVRNLKEEV